MVRHRTVGGAVGDADGAAVGGCVGATDGAGDGPRVGNLVLSSGGIVSFHAHSNLRVYWTSGSFTGLSFGK